ncbi:hypothetical protein CK203_103955 [Vitis vinifera]|uniref:Uncharacterized protein n=1 Tax=Vitis vinifera TaxID=29760 RepID=A0A438FIS0_VITVI|nr:hypothetical protein CK203_103955 [Vitis vinifera]
MFSYSSFLDFLDSKQLGIRVSDDYWCKGFFIREEEEWQSPPFVSSFRCCCCCNSDIKKRLELDNHFVLRLKISPML